MAGKNQPLWALVEDVFPFGAFVRLKDGRRAYIRRRELSLSGDIDPRQIVKPGDEVQAVNCAPAKNQTTMELSLRALLPDPWVEHGSRLQLGAVVTGTVKSLTGEGVFVQIEPGLDGFIPLNELASWPVERPEELLWRKDEVEAVITHLDLANRRLRLSLRSRRQQLERAQEFLKGLQSQTWSEKAGGQTEQTKNVSIEDPQANPVLESHFDPANTYPVLVVEDHKEVRQPLVKWLKDQGYQAVGEAAAAQALALCQEQEYQLVLVDLDMPGMDGLTFMHKLRTAGNLCTLAVMSDPELIARNLPDLQALNVSAVFTKPLDTEEIYRFLIGLSEGSNYSLNLEVDEFTSPADIRPFQNLAAIMRSGQALDERFQAGLTQLLEETRAEKGIVFRLDRASGEVTIVAEAGDLLLNHESIYQLVDSPVKDVIEEGDFVWEKSIPSEKAGRFRKLQALVRFESVIGVPFQAGGGTEHALFLFHREAEVFSRYRLRDVLAMANFFAVALESQALNERIHSLSGIFLSGQLAAGFGHEVYNKLSGLDLQFRNLRYDVQHLPQQFAQLRASPDFQEVERALEQAVATAVDLKTTVENFRRLMEARREAVVDANAVLQSVITQLRPLARRARVELQLDPGENLPLAAGTHTGLQQVFLNLGLNAIQHMEQSPAGQRRLTISSRFQPGSERYLIQVRVCDTGLGIHRRLWEKIFALGYTTRSGGSGLGLFIARSLVESMGGRIFVEESYLSLGTTFLVELQTV